MNRTRRPMLRLIRGLGRRVLNRPLLHPVARRYERVRRAYTTQRYLRELDQHDLRLNIGCGLKPLAGWVNLDIWRFTGTQIVHDIKNGIPLRSGSCSVILMEHVIEHLTRDEARDVLAECNRLLGPGGTLRISTPDAERHARAYIDNDEAFLHDSRHGLTIDTSVDRLNYMMREWGHQWIYDARALQVILKQSGFDSVSVSAFGQSGTSLLVGVDAAERAFESVYVEAAKHA